MCVLWAICPTQASLAHMSYYRQTLERLSVLRQRDGHRGALLGWCLALCSMEQQFEFLWAVDSVKGNDKLFKWTGSQEKVRGSYWVHYLFYSICCLILFYFKWPNVTTIDRAVVIDPKPFGDKYSFLLALYDSSEDENNLVILNNCMNIVFCRTLCFTSSTYKVASKDCFGFIYKIFV